MVGTRTLLELYLTIMVLQAFIYMYAFGPVFTGPRTRAQIPRLGGMGTTNDSDYQMTYPIYKTFRNPLQSKAQIIEFLDAGAHFWFNCRARRLIGPVAAKWMAGYSAGGCGQ